MSSRTSNRSQRSVWLIYAAIAVVGLFAMGRVGIGLVGSNGSNVNCAQAIAWDEAENYVGEEVTVYGPVVSAVYASNEDGQPTFLNLGRDYPNPDRLTVVIWGDLRAGFAEPPERMYQGREVCVSGEIQMYEGAPEIELSSREAIELAD